MLDNHDNRNLSDVFKELQEMQSKAKAVSTLEPPKNATNTIISNTDSSFSNSTSSSTKSKSKTKKKSTSSLKHSHPNYDLKLSHIIVGCGILIVGLAVFFPKNTSFTQSYAKEENLEAVSEYELNRHRLNIQSIISENADMDRV